MAAYEIKITASDGTTQVFKAITDGAQKMGSELEKTGQKAKKGADDLDGFSKKAGAIGAGIGTAVSALSLLGQAFISQERQINQLERQYGSAADEILQFTERIQDSTRFSNDAARSAASISAGLASQYGLSIDQIEQLITRSADLAQTSGLSLEDVVQRTSSALRGEAESAELLGLSLNDANVARYAAAQGISDYSTGLDEAGRAQVRLNLFLEQSAFATGAAGEAAGNAAGQADQFKNSIQDGAQALGGFLGPAASVSATLGQSALLLPLAGAGFGKLAVGARAAVSGALLLSTALGPIGLAAAAVAGVAALIGLSGAFDDTDKASADTADTVDSLTTAIYALQDAGASSQILLQAQAIQSAFQTAKTELEGYNEANEASIAAEEERLGALRIRPDVITNQTAIDEIDRQMAALIVTEGELGTATEQVTGILSRLGDTNIDGGRLAADLQALIASFQLGAENGGISADRFLTEVDLLFQGIDENYRSLPSAAAAFDVLTYSLLDGTTAAQEFDGALANILEAADRFGTGAIQGIRDYVTALEAVRAAQLAAGNFNGATETTAVIKLANAEIERIIAERVAIVAGGAAGVRQAVADEVAAEREANLAILDAYRERKDAARQVIAEAVQARRESALAIADTYRSALGQTSDAPFLEGLDEMVAVGDLSEEQAVRIRSAFDALAASGASTLGIVVGLADALGYAGTEAIGFAAGLYDAVDATDGVLGLFGAIDNLGNRLSSANTIASDLFGEGGDAFDGLGPLVDLLNNGTISQEQFNQAVAAGTQIQADNTRGQESLNAVRANLLPLLADQTTELANYYAELAAGSEVEQQRALYLADTANQQQVLTLANAVYAASIGEIPPEVVTTLVADAANADPILKQTLEDLGLISVGADGTISVNFPDGESLPATITTLNDTLLDLVAILEEVAGVGDPFGPLADGASKLAGIDFSNLDGVKGLLGGGAGSVLNAGGSGNGIGGMIGAFGDRGISGSIGKFGGGTGGGQPPPSAFPEAVPGAGVGPQEIRVSYIVDVQANQAQEILAGIAGEVTIIDAATGEVTITANDEVARQAIDDTTSGVYVVDNLTGEVTFIADNAGAINGADEVKGRFDGIDGQTALLYALGDSSGAENAASAAGAAIAGVDGVTGSVYVQGIDNYSGVINAAGRYAGAVLATSYIDIITRQYTQKLNSFFSNGGVVGYADGGIPAAANGMVMVGEAGPELVRLPGGSQVIPSPASQAIARDMRGEGGSQPLVFNNYGSINGIEDLAGFIYDGLAQAAAMERASMGGR